MAGSAQAGAAHGKPCPRGFWSPGPWIRSPGELEETAHNGRVRLKPSNRPAVESAALPSRATVTAEVCELASAHPLRHGVVPLLVPLRDLGQCGA